MFYLPSPDSYRDCPGLFRALKLNMNILFILENGCEFVTTPQRSAFTQPQASFPYIEKFLFLVARIFVFRVLRTDLSQQIFQTI